MAARDPQAQRIYAWEEKWLDWNRRTLTRDDVESLVQKSTREYGMVSPRVKYHRGKEYSYCQGDVISFNLHDCNPAIVLHECAHYITDALFSPAEKLAAHSPQFMGVYLYLLEWHRVAPRAALHASAKAARIQWVPTGMISPKRLRRGRFA